MSYMKVMSLAVGEAYSRSLSYKFHFGIVNY